MNLLKNPRFLLLGVAIAWSLVAGICFLSALSTIAEQRRTETFVSTPGVMDDIREVESTGPTGMTYTLQVRYHYGVAGERYDSTRLRFGERSAPHAITQDLLRKFPQGSRPTVYFDPQHPAQAVLLRGSDGGDVVGLVRQIPFLLVAGLLWLATHEAFARTPRFPGLHTREEETITRLRPADARACLLGAAVLIAGGIIGLLLPGVDSSLSTATLTCAIVSMPGLLIAGVMIGRTFRGLQDLVIDPDTQTIALPGGEEVPFARVQGVYVTTPERVHVLGQQAVSVVLQYKAPPAAQDAPEEAAPPAPQKPVPKHFVVRQWLFDEEDAQRLALYLALRLKTQAFSPSGRGLIEAPPDTRRTTAPLKPVTTAEVKAIASPTSTAAAKSPAAAPAAKPVHKPFKRTPLPPRSS